MLSHPPLPLFTTFLSPQGRSWLTGSYLMCSPFPKNPTKTMLDSLDQYPSFQLSVKVLERHLHQLLMDLLLSRIVLSDMQFGFRKDRSTIIPLLIAMHQWHLSLAKHHKVACAFFDFAKAFESVPYEALLNILHQLNILPVLFRWLSNYLSDRFQRVVINGTCSSWLLLTSGYPRDLSWDHSCSCSM